MARGKAEVKNTKYEQYMRIRHHLCGPCEILFNVDAVLEESRVAIGLELTGSFAGFDGS